MLNQKGATGKAKPALNFATDQHGKGSARWLSSPHPFAASASLETLRVAIQQLLAEARR